MKECVEEVRIENVFKVRCTGRAGISSGAIVDAKAAVWGALGRALRLVGTRVRKKISGYGCLNGVVANVVRGAAKVDGARGAGDTRLQ